MPIKMKVDRSSIVLWIALVPFVFASVASADSPVSLSVGEEQLIELSAIAKTVDIQDASVVQVTKGDSKTKIFIKGLKIGDTTITVNFADKTSQKFDVVVGNKLSLITKELASVGGIKTSEQNGKILVEGVLSNREQILNLKYIKDRYNGLIIDATEQNLASSNTILKTINRVLKENDLSNFQAHAYGKIITLEGSAKDPAQAELALRIASIIHPGIENRIAKDSNGAPAVSIEVMFVEVTKSDNKEIGLPRAFGDAKHKEQPFGLAQATVGAKSGSINSGFGVNWQIGGLTTFLKMIQEKANSRVLSNPKLIARSGNEANFHAGNTTYLTSMKVEKETVQAQLLPVETGIILKITPKLDSIGQIDAQIETSVSEFGDVKKDVFPSISTSKVATAVTINDGQTILLSGLLKKRNTKTVDRVPVLADVPLVGELFKSRKVEEQETEMMVLVTMNRVRAFDGNQKSVGEQLWKSAASDIVFSLHD